MNTDYCDLVVAPAFTIAVPAATGLASTATTETTPTTTRAIFTRSGKVYCQRTTTEILTVEHGNGILGFFR
jgi:hypothetical protein